MRAGADDPIRFAEKLIVLLDQGGFTATYKYAVLIALMDLCLENGGADGAAPTSITTPQLAARVVALYWPQTRPFGDRSLRQNTGRPAKILSLVREFKREHAPDPGCSAFRAERHAPDAYRRLVREVEWKLEQMPLPKLQRIGREVVPFIYTLSWTDEVKRSEFSSRDFDNRILLQPGVGDHLTRLAGVLRPLIYRQWAAMVARLNELEESKLEEFLFGATRTDLSPVRDPLRELQSSRCFYCGDGMRTDLQVDHFLPWARNPNDSIENLVVAHGRCNAQKSDFLAAGDHVVDWCAHLQAHQADLDTIAADVGWERGRARTVSVVRSIYTHLPDDVRLWHAGNEFVPLERGRVQRGLSSLVGWAR